MLSYSELVVINVRRWLFNAIPGANNHL